MLCFAVFVFFPQALCACPGQLWDVQCGTAPPPALQRRPPPVLPHVAGEDLCAERHKSGAAGHSGKVSPTSSVLILISLDLRSQPWVNL